MFERIRRGIAAAQTKIDELNARLDARLKEIADSFEAQRKDKAQAKKLRGQIARTLDAKRVQLELDLDTVSARIRHRRKKRLRTIYRKRELRKRLRFWVVKRTKYRKRLKELRRQEHPAWEPWMANGHDDHVDPAVKAYMAVAVVHFGLTITSLRRNYIPAGGSPTSLHLDGQAGDAAGPRHKMVAFQRWVLKHVRGLVEMFGPDNALNYKDGQQISQAEGSPNEDLHDTHVHVGAR